MQTLNSPAAEQPDFRIRTATAADADAVVELVSLVDLHLRADEAATALATMRYALTATDDGPLSHQNNHFLLAETSGGIPVGVVVCGPPYWIARPGRMSGLVRRRLVHRLSCVHNLAVRPEHRGHGIARALLRETEAAFRNAGYAALTLRHDRDLSAFYQRLGYTSATRLSLMLPPLGLITLTDQGWKHAFKLLSPDASAANVQGLPTICGLLPD
ncbi:GNAT family N-acetyltransferase [Streptomyces sp. NPDC047525]|uniref:GNAT family N-acetyltransferase n=1 Tax=Streptomyces sp. NPDC047525 TaxID=3155264 RepID=UPI0033E8BB23